MLYAIPHVVILKIRDSKDFFCRLKFMSHPIAVQNKQEIGTHFGQ